MEDFYNSWVKKAGVIPCRQLDPDKWFNNVEVVTAEKTGIETTTYVRNIFKYYASYKLTQDAQARAIRIKQQVAPIKN